MSVDDYDYGCVMLCGGVRWVIDGYLRFRSVFGTAGQIVKDEGFLRLWRGNLTNCVRVVPNTATQFMSYERYKVLLLGEAVTL